MEEIQRQEHRNLREAVELAAEGRATASLALLRPWIAEVSHATDRYAAIAAHYMKLTPSERKGTLVVAGTHRAREVINELIRDRLGYRGAGVPINVLISKDFTEAQRKSSISYQKGDVVQTQRKYESLGLRAAEFATVVTAGSGYVVLQRQDGETIEWRPVLMPHVAVYRVAERELTVGETARITANDYGRGLINGETVTVAGIDRGKDVLTLVKGNGEVATLDLSKPLHLEHGYCTTVHSAQGKTCERVIIDADATSATANESLYYVAISRARKEVSIYTDDKMLLPDAMSRADKKTIALSLPEARDSQKDGRKNPELSL